MLALDQAGVLKLNDVFQAEAYSRKNTIVLTTLAFWM